MTHSAGVAGQVKSLRKLVRTPQTRRQHVEHELRKMRCFVHENDVVFLPLILQDVVVVVQITKFQTRTVRENKYFFRLTVSRYIPQ